MDDVHQDLESRLASGGAARLAEMARFEHRWGRDFAAGIGEEVEAIARGVTAC